MTWKKHNGKLDIVKISILVGIVSGLAVAARPSFEIASTVLSPWFQVPARQQKMEERQERMEAKLDTIIDQLNIERVTFMPTNRTHNLVWKKENKE